MAPRNNGKNAESRTEFIATNEEAPEAKVQKQRLVRRYFGGQNRCPGKCGRR